jgi:hypothetical protein
VTDIIDDANERADKWLTAQIEEHQYMMGHAVSAFEAGRCRNCDEKLDDGRNYCDENCRDDHWKRICADKRRSNRSR